ncbi:MAG: L-glutamate gamma-semialdehyde dehydrogenase [Balneolaceae bacterium]
MRDLTLEKYRNEVYLNFDDPFVDKQQKEAIEQVRNNFENEHDLYINGEFVKGEKGTFKSTNPSNTDEVIGEFQSASKDQAIEAMDHAWKAFEDWQYVSAGKRARYLFRAANVIRKRRLEINAWMISESGKNYTEADADTCEAIDFIEYYAYEALRLDQGMGVIDSKSDNNKTIYMPMGAGVTISPWNFPFAIFTGMAMAPVAAGNTVVAKPAPDTPKMGYLLAEILHEVGLPKGVFNYVTGGDIEVGENLARYENTRFISFTGSMKVGLHLNQIAAEPTGDDQKFLKRIVTEMGGKNAVVVDSDADLDLAADSVVQSAYGYQGQKCSAGSRVIAHKDIYQELLDKVIERTQKIQVGNARENYGMGPVINQQAVDKIMNYIEIGKKEGTLVTGGEQAETPENGYYIQPTIFTDISPDDRIAQEEIFGPVVAFIKADNTDHAIEIANNTRYGLTGAYHSKNQKKIEKALREFKVGNLYINRGCTGSLVGAQPFGGFNMSGNDAKAGGRDYLLHFLLPRSLTYRPREDVDFDLKFFDYADE